MHTVLWFQILLHSALSFVCQYYPIKGVTSVSTPTPLPQPITKPQCSDTTINGDADGVISAYYYNTCTTLPSNPSFNDRITSIGSYAFLGCTSLITIVLPKDIKLVAYGAFKDCTSITTITFPNHYTESIEANAFQKCTSLDTITIPRYIKTELISILTSSYNVQTIKIQTNNVCSYDHDIATASFDLYVRNDKTVLCSRTLSVITSTFNVGSIDIPDTIHTLHKMAYRCDGLINTITVPSCIRSIEQDVFDGCTGITAIIIEGKVQYIDKFAFRETTKMTSYTIKNNAHTNTNDMEIAYLSIDGFIYTADKEELLCVPTSTAQTTCKIPYQLKRFNPLCFPSKSCRIEKFNMYSSDGRTILALPSTGAYLTIDVGGTYIYDNLQTTLTKVAPAWAPQSFTIPSTISTIGTGAFANGHINQTININAITHIEEWAFYCCQTKHMSIPSIAQIVYVERQAFHACLFTELIFPPIPSMVQYAFAYAHAKTIVISEGVEIIEENICSMGSVESITLPATLREIHQQAFKNTPLKHIDLPNISLSYIGFEAFSGCAKLDHIIIPGCVTRVDELAFADCTLAQFVVIMNCNTCSHPLAFRSNENRLQPECIATYWFSPMHCLPCIVPVDIFAKILTSGMILYGSCV